MGWSIKDETSPMAKPCAGIEQVWAQMDAIISKENGIVTHFELNNEDMGIGLFMSIVYQDLVDLPFVDLTVDNPDVLGWLVEIESSQRPSAWLARSAGSGEPINVFVHPTARVFRKKIIIERSELATILPLVMDGVTEVKGYEWLDEQLFLDLDLTMRRGALL